MFVGKGNLITSTAESIEEPTVASDVQDARVLVLLCTYNEGENVGKMLAALNHALPSADVLVVDDNSPDGTADIVRKLAANDSRYHLLVRPGKLGLGTALRDGIRWCLDRQYDYLINLDSDLSHNPNSVPTMLAACMRPNVDVAVGSRYVTGGSLDGLAWHRRLISRALNGYATRILRLPISDCSGSFRCYRTTALRRLDLSQLQCAGYGFLEEILVTMYRRGAKLAEVPIQFETRHAGESKLSLGDAVGALKVIHSLALRSSKA